MSRGKVPCLVILWTALLVCCPFHATSAAGGAVSFEKETVIIHIDRGSVLVTGYYCFTNRSSSPTDQRLFYPFPVDSTHRFPEDISVVSGGKDVPFRKAETGVFFTASLPGRCSICISVEYRQECLEPAMCYVLTSTAAWRRPLAHAAFEIHVPPDVDLNWISYEIDQISEVEGLKVFKFSKDNFMPSEDLCLEWRRVKSSLAL